MWNPDGEDKSLPEKISSRLRTPEETFKSTFNNFPLVRENHGVKVAAGKLVISDGNRFLEATAEIQEWIRECILTWNLKP